MTEWLLRDESAIVDEPTLPALPPRPRAPVPLDLRLRDLRAFVPFSFISCSSSSFGAGFEREPILPVFETIDSSTSEDGSMSLIGLMSREEGLTGDFGGYVKIEVSIVFHLVEDILLMMEDDLEGRCLDGAFEAGVLESEY